MRRWFEFGFDGNFANPRWEMTSNQSHQHGQVQSSLNPLFVSMPFKQQMFEILAGTSLVDFPGYSWFPATIQSGGSTAAPLTNANMGDSCNAEHVVNGANVNGWRVAQFFTGGYWQMILGGFPKPAGGFTPPIITVNFAPPSDNG